MTAGTLGKVSGALAIAGAASSAIGSWYAVDAQKGELRSQALSLDFQASVANINARSAEIDAAAIRAAGRRSRGLLTLAAGQERGRAVVSQASRGLRAGSGTTAETLASLAFAKESDALTIDANTFRAESAARRRAIDFRNQGRFARVSAQNARDTAGSLSPGLAAATSLLGSAGRVSGQFARNSRLNRLFGGT
jgi:hypothetical protein